MFSFPEKTTQMNNAQADSEKETLDWKHDSMVKPDKVNPTKSVFNNTHHFFSRSTAPFLVMMLTVGSASLSYADWNETEEGEDQPMVEQFINEEDDSGSPEPIPDAPDLDEMEDQGELEGYDTEEAEQ
ncbi:MAG: hypothetical protein ACR2PX_24475 [Endozoicomonas sp.]|uniref:hypothetical protein n=1 Tax=Endozoicomonas sp. TaxID=1892382 RepID=UPI003D9BB4BB